MNTVIAIAAGFLLDCLLGDPEELPHPVVAVGRLIATLEIRLRKSFPPTPSGERRAGRILVMLVLALSWAVPQLALWLLGGIHPLLRLAAESLLCYQILALRCLREESTAVYRKVQSGDLPAAQHQVSRIVGRDTGSLSMEGVIKATVETVAENTSDGVVAPLFYMALGGAPLGMLYKAANTMDSMVGYKNERYLHFGRAAARLDDLLNWIPARISGVLMVPSAGICGLDMQGAWHIYHRDRKQHASPNAAQTEAACAGALGVRLAGDASYFGRVVRKPSIGDDLRAVRGGDILDANQLMTTTSVLAALFFLGVRILIGW